MGAEIFDSICFGVVAAVDVYSDEVISQDALENAHVVGDDGLGPVLFSLSYVSSIAGALIGRLDVRQGT